MLHRRRCIVLLGQARGCLQQLSLNMLHSLHCVNVHSKAAATFARTRTQTHDILLMNIIRTRMQSGIQNTTCVETRSTYHRLLEQRTETWHSTQPSAHPPAFLPFRHRLPEPYTRTAFPLRVSFHQVEHTGKEDIRAAGLAAVEVLLGPKRCVRGRVDHRVHSPRH